MPEETAKGVDGAAAALGEKQQDGQDDVMTPQEQEAETASIEPAATVIVKTPAANRQSSTERMHAMEDLLSH